MTVDQIKLLVVDDSKLMREALCDLFNADPHLCVVGTAMDGMEAVQKTLQCKPDVITLDLKMPGYDGQYAVEHIMMERPTPVIMVSNYTISGAQATLKALSAGAFDFFAKDKGFIAEQNPLKRKELIAKVKVAARINPEVLHSKLSEPSFPDIAEPDAGQGARGPNAIAIGASTGGPPAIEQILYTLPEEFPVPILIVQHLPKLFTNSFAERLNGISKLHVKEAEEGELVKAGIVYICPGDRNIKVKRLPDLSQGLSNKVIISFSDNPLSENQSLSVDVLMESVAELYGSSALGIILSGMGSDGVTGLKKIQSAGGMTIAQDEDTSVVYGMPKAAVDQQVVTKVLPLPQIAGFINHFSKEKIGA